MKVTRPDGSVMELTVKEFDEYERLSKATNEPSALADVSVVEHKSVAEACNSTLEKVGAKQRVAGTYSERSYTGVLQELLAGLHALNMTKRSTPKSTRMAFTVTLAGAPISRYRRNLQAHLVGTWPLYILPETTCYSL